MNIPEVRLGIFAINEMDRFYRHVLIQKHYPHHGAVAFHHCGKALYEVFKYFGVKDIAYNPGVNIESIQTAGSIRGRLILHVKDVNWSFAYTFA